LVVFLIVSHLMALIAVTVAGIGIARVITLYTLILMALYRGLHRHALLRGRRSVTRLAWGAGDGWQLTCRDGRRYEGRLSPDSFCRPWLAVLVFRIAHRRRLTVILPTDAVPGASLRRLRVRMKLTAHAGSERR
jgi:hypothetical protein